MIHASTSEPSAEIAVKRSGSESSSEDVKAEPTSVSRLSPEKSSGGETGVDAACTTWPPAQSKPVTQTSPSIVGSGGVAPSASTRYGLLLPASSTTNSNDSPAQTGSPPRGGRGGGGVR